MHSEWRSQICSASGFRQACPHETPRALPSRPALSLNSRLDNCLPFAVAVLTTPVPALDPADSFTPGSISKSEDQLRREFQAFLTRTGRYALTTDPAAFDALFQGYQQWRLRTKPDGSLVGPR